MSMDTQLELHFAAVVPGPMVSLTSRRYVQAHAKAQRCIFFELGSRRSVERMMLSILVTCCTCVCTYSAFAEDCSVKKIP